MRAFGCPCCESFVAFESLKCDACGTEVAYQPETRTLVELFDHVLDSKGREWLVCSDRPWGCNWLAAADSGSAQCRASRLIRRRPDSDDTLALEKLASTAGSLRRLYYQVDVLGLPIVGWWETKGGLAFDLLSSYSTNSPVVIGHADGVITIDLAESLDAHREQLRVSLGEPYRTMLGHFRHEVGHYYQNVLIENGPYSGMLDECRSLFGDERASYSDAIARHYRTGARHGWEANFISEYATMHPWEDFAECFAHYLHITDTLETAASSGMTLGSNHINPYRAPVITPRTNYCVHTFSDLTEDWNWLALFFNRINTAMGQRPVYPFITPAVTRKLEFIHRLVLAVNEKVTAND